jgi:hypothetical protein
MLHAAQRIMPGAAEGAGGVAEDAGGAAEDAGGAVGDVRVSWRCEEPFWWPAA